MPIVKVNDAVETYRMKASGTNVHDMAGRGQNTVLTEFVNSRIAGYMVLAQSDVLVDIGCGDGHLLREAYQVARRIGTVGTVDECERLQKETPELIFKVGLANALPIESGVANKIVCNAVLMYLQSEHKVEMALAEIARIASANAKIWIGELPIVDEYSQYNMYLGSSISGLLWHSLSKHNLRTFLGMCRKLLRSVLGREQLVLNSAHLYYSSPANFISLAERCGLRLESFFPHKELDSLGRVFDSPYRFDYVFRK